MDEETLNPMEPVFCQPSGSASGRGTRPQGFLPEDIRRAVERAAPKQCFVCGESGATITCHEMGCHRSFHLPCAVEGGCVTQFFFQFRSFCWEHCPQQAVEAAPDNTTICLICLELVGDRKSHGTLVCPACKHAWFHRACIQGQAVRDGICSFQCPLCRDRDAFLSEMLTMGIQVPFRPWELLLCTSCAAEGTHVGCSYLRSSTAGWECNSCAGLGTESSASSELAGPSTASQPGSESPSSSPALWGGLRPSGPGPMLERNRSRFHHQAQNRHIRPRGRQERSHVPAPRAGSDTPSQAVQGPSISSLAPEASSPSTTRPLASRSSRGSRVLQSSRGSSPPGPVRTQDHYNLRHRAQHPYS
nr:PREDICTED: G2/M phase-specific E3 ubiquitin-protein ligase-like [Opisthocomus hoazin]